MNKLIVCFAPSDMTAMRRALKKMSCSIDRWEVGQPFPPHVHVVSALTAKRFAQSLPVQAVVFKATSDPDKKRYQNKVKFSTGRSKKDENRQSKKQTVPVSRKRKAGNIRNSRYDEYRYNPNARGSQVGDSTYTRDFRDVDVPGASQGYLHGHDEDM